MTCIVGIVDRKTNNVVIGGDSAGVINLDVTARKDEKVFENGNFIFGCAGSFRMMQLLRYSFTPPEKPNIPTYKYMTTDFIDGIRKTFKKGGYLKKWSDGEEKGGVFLVGYENRLFKIDTDFQVIETLRGYDACGCGELYALASVFNSKKTNSKNIVLEALKTAEYFSGGVVAPFNFVETGP